MRSQGELEQIPQEVVKQISELEMRIMLDIVRKIKENGFSSASADWQVTRLVQLGESERRIKDMVQQALGNIDADIDRIFSDTAYEEYYGHARSYELFGREPIPFEENTQLQEVIEAARRQTSDTFRNMTGSMGFALKNPATGKVMYSPLMKFYQETMDAAMWDIFSGSFDYGMVSNRTISRLTASGVRWIDYDSGARNRVDVAARRAVMTGFRQIQAKINEQVAAELGTDTYEVSAHVGARPTHQPWQGRVWTMRQLQDVCGLGDITGLCGINCYHDYQPFPPGSVRTYTDEQLAQMMREENVPLEYAGKQYTTYEALQRQRAMERNMRATRQQIKLMEAGGASKQDIILKKARYQGQMQEYKNFSKSMGLPEQMKRVYQDGLRGKFTPTKTQQKVLEEMAANDKIKAELSDAKIRGIAKLNPDKIDVSGFTYDESHINLERSHGVTRMEAEQFIKEADISLTKWNGRFVNYYGPNGATFVDLENNNIRTAFRREQFDDAALKIREVAEKYGIKKD